MSSYFFSNSSWICFMSWSLFLDILNFFCFLSGLTLSHLWTKCTTLHLPWIPSSPFFFFSLVDIISWLHFTPLFSRKCFLKPRIGTCSIFPLRPIFFLSKQLAHLLQFLIHSISNKLNCEPAWQHLLLPLQHLLNFSISGKSLLRGKF